MYPTAHHRVNRTAPRARDPERLRPHASPRTSTPGRGIPAPDAATRGASRGRPRCDAAADHVRGMAQMAAAHIRRRPVRSCVVSDIHTRRSTALQGALHSTEHNLTGHCRMRVASAAGSATVCHRVHGSIRASDCSPDGSDTVGRPSAAPAASRTGATTTALLATAETKTAAHPARNHHDPGGAKPSPGVRGRSPPGGVWGCTPTRHSETRKAHAP